MKLETLLSPMDLPELARRDLSDSTCVVFDILRATSTFVTALERGAAGIIPVSEIGEAIALQRKNPGLLLAGERAGVRIRADRSGGVDFDFGNSPREFTTEKIRGRTIASTTTNGTRALRACSGARRVLAASFLNLAATADFLRGEREVLLICAGTGDNPATEDIIAAGALAELLLGGKDTHSPKSVNSTAARAAYFQAMQTSLEKSFSKTENGSRLLSIPELREDVAFCAQRDIFHLVAAMGKDGVLRRA